MKMLMSKAKAGGSQSALIAGMPAAWTAVNSFSSDSRPKVTTEAKTMAMGKVKGRIVGTKSPTNLRTVSKFNPLLKTRSIRSNKRSKMRTKRKSPTPKKKEGRNWRKKYRANCIYRLYINPKRGPRKTRFSSVLFQEFFRGLNIKSP
jgi:hypothetical protein